MEIWKDIQGYEGLYQVSNMGRVKRLETYVKHKNGNRLVKEKILTTQTHKYQSVFLSNNHIKQHYIHRLVAEHFLPNPKNYPVVMHLDNNPKNNNISNLQWGTYSMNSKHAVKTGVWNNQFTINKLSKI